MILADWSSRAKCGLLGDRLRHHRGGSCVPGGGAITPGRHVRYKYGIPLSNLYLGMLNRVCVTPGRFGDSTEPLKDLQV